MRTVLLVLGVLTCVGLLLGSIGWVQGHASDAVLTEEARMAIDLRCRGREGRAHRECRATLKKLYLAGALDPDKTIRAYCERVKRSRWGGSRPAPPKVCVQRYGGWQPS